MPRASTALDKPKTKKKYPAGFPRFQSIGGGIRGTMTRNQPLAEYKQNKTMMSIAASS